MLEVEREDRKSVAFGVRHHRRVREAEVEIREPFVDLRGASQQRRRQEADLMFAVDQRRQEQPSGLRAHARSKEMVSLNDHRIRDNEVSAEFRYKRSGESVRLVACIRCGDEGSGIRNDLHRAVVGSRR